MKIKFTAILLLIVLNVSTVFASLQYKISDLGTLESSFSMATSINNSGQVCGTYYDQKQSKTFIFLWDPQNGFHNLDIQALNYYGTVINNNGQIAGIYTTDSFYGRAFLWDPITGFIDLKVPTLPNNSAHQLQMLDMNDLGQILIRGDDTIYLYQNYFLQRKYLNNLKPHGSFKINNSSEVFGNAVLFKDNKSIRYVGCHFKLDDENSMKLIELKGIISTGNFNNKGKGVGVVQTVQGITRGFVWDPEEGVNFTPGFKPLFINDKGLMVGKNEFNKLAVWDHGVIIDLEFVLDLDNNLDTDWECIDQVFDLNDSGQIVGAGKINGKTHAILLTPLRD